MKMPTQNETTFGEPTFFLKQKPLEPATQDGPPARSMKRFFTERKKKKAEAPPVPEEPIPEASEPLLSTDTEKCSSSSNDVEAQGIVDAEASSSEPTLPEEILEKNSIEQSAPEITHSDNFEDDLEACLNYNSSVDVELPQTSAQHNQIDTEPEETEDTVEVPPSEGMMKLRQFLTNYFAKRQSINSVPSGP